MKIIRGLAADYVVIEEGEAPSLLRGLAWLSGAVIGVLYVWRRLQAPHPVA